MNQLKLTATPGAASDMQSRHGFGDWRLLISTPFEAWDSKATKHFT